MALTPEQFNLLATRGDLEKQGEDIREIKKDLKENFNKVFDVLDVLVKKKGDQEAENVANLEAHARMNRDLLKLKEYNNLDSMEVLEQVE